MVRRVNILVCYLRTQYLLFLLFLLVIQGLRLNTRSWDLMLIGNVRDIKILKTLFRIYLLIQIGRKHALEFLVFIPIWAFALIFQ